MDRGAWRAIVHVVAESDVALANLHVASAVIGLRLKTMKMRSGSKRTVFANSPLNSLQL